MKKLLGLVTIMVVLFGSCSLWDTSLYTDAVKDMVLMTGIAENEENTLSRATLPLWTGGALSTGIDVSSLTSTGSSLTGSLSDYPEKYQTTNYTVTNKGNSVYFIQTTTIYPGQSRNREVTYEDYYLNSTNTVLTNDDPVCVANGTTDPKFRERFETTFVLKGLHGDKISSLRKETITSLKDPDGDSYGSFKDVDINAVLNAGTFTPTTASAQFSSKVTYTQTFTQDDTGRMGLDVELGKTSAISVSGTRYYTEIVSSGTTECSALYIEEFKDESGATVGRTVTKYWYTITNNVRSNKTVDAVGMLITKKGTVNYDL